MRFLVISNHPALATHATRRAGPGVRAPLQWRGTGKFRRGAKFPSAEGWHDTGPRENAIFVGGCAGVVIVVAGDNKKSAVWRIIISQVR